MFRVKKESKPEAAKIERAASGMSEGQLRDNLQLYVNSAATAVNLVVREGMLEGLDTLQDNCRCLITLAAELQTRRIEDIAEFPDNHLHDLVGKYMAKKGIHPSI